MIRQLLVLPAGLLLGALALAAGNEYRLGVKGVACPYCAYGVEKRLLKVEGVSAVQIDIGDSVVRVTMADGASLSEAAARTAVEEAGFTLHTFTTSDTADDAFSDE